MKKIKLLLLILLSFSSFSQQKIVLSDIWTNYRFYSRSVNNLDWLSDNTYLEIGKTIAIKSIEQDIKPITIDKEIFADSLNISSFITSNTNKTIAFTANNEELYRRSSKAYVIIFDLENNKILAQTKNKVYNPSFSDDNKHLAYTYNNNLFVLDIETNKETQLTFDGKWNSILNGRSDWVYEEEFGFTQAYQWIPNTSKIAFLSFDETEVKTYNMQKWNTELYPTLYSYKYPKAGEHNSIVTLKLIDIHTKENKTLLSTQDNSIEYISKIVPTNKENTFCYGTMNRLQNKLELFHYNTQSKQSTSVYSEESDKYVELPSGPFYTEQGFIIDSYKTGNRHFHHITPEKTTDLTKGNFDVKDFLHYDGNCLYFTALIDNSYTQSLCISKKGKTKKFIKSKDWVSANFSPNGTYGIITNSSLENPHLTTLIEIEKNTILDTLSENKHISTYVETLALGKHEFFEVNAPEGHKIPCLKILPPNFDKKKKYPILMHCYGGPGHQVVANKWNPFDYWYHQLLAQKGYIIVLADGRGTDGNGTKYRQASYEQFGNLEHKDQVTVAKYFREQPYVDSSKIGIWGWSFGGYLSSLCLMKSPDVFSFAIAVAPVTNWRFYDNIYTERYMGLPQENPKGYDENSPTFYAKNLKGKYLLLHGTGDDNVHLQNSISMQSELLKYNKQFETFYYPDKNHGIYGGSTRYNLYQKMLTFIETNFTDYGN